MTILIENNTVFGLKNKQFSESLRSLIPFVTPITSVVGDNFFVCHKHLCKTSYEDTLVNIERYKIIPTKITLPDVDNPVTGTVSVVITCHNYDMYLQDCVRSAINQTIKPDKIVIINDSSTDDTWILGQGFSKHSIYDNIEYYYVEYKDVAKARAFGASKCNTDYVIFLDADDTLSPTYIEDMKKIDADVVFGPIKQFEDGHLFWEPIQGDIEKDNFCHIGCMVKRSFLTPDVFGSAHDYPAEDWEMWKRIARKGAVFKKSNAVYNYRIHGQGRSSIRIKDPSNIIVGYYFAGSPDPQRNSKLDMDNPEVIRTWAESAIKCGLKPIVISDHDLERCKAELGIEYRNYGPVPEWTHILVYRFYTILELLDEIDVKNIFVTDATDVEVKNNPYHIMDTANDLWIGSEGLIGDDDASQWLKTRLKNIGDEKDYTGKILYNAGIIGGHIGAIIDLYISMWEFVKGRGNYEPNASCMATLNHILHKSQYKIKTGAPLHSRFKKYENRDDVCFIHK